MKKGIFAIAGVLVIVIATLVFLRKTDDRNAAKEEPAQNTSTRLETEQFYYEDDYTRIPRITPSKFNRRKEPVKLSDFVEELNIIHLDSDNPLALIGNTIRAVLSENHIGVWSNSEPRMPFRLYDKGSGRFIRAIGNIGRGPGEYTSLYDYVIDEGNDRIYLAPFAEKRILEYTLSGEYIGDIPVPALMDNGARKMKIEVRDSVITAYTLPFPRDELVGATFTKSGKVLSTIPNPFGGVRSFDHELFVGKGDAVSGYMATSAPIFYRYDHASNSLSAVYGIDYGDIEGFWFPVVFDTPRYVLVTVNFATPDGSVSPDNYLLAIDKRTDEKFSGDLANDYLGGYNPLRETKTVYVENGYYIEAMSAVALKRLLGEALAIGSMAPEVRARVEALNSSFDEDDNHFLFYGKLK